MILFKFEFKKYNEEEMKRMTIEQHINKIRETDGSVDIK